MSTSTFTVTLDNITVMNKELTVHKKKKDVLFFSRFECYLIMAIKTNNIIATRNVNVIHFIMPILLIIYLFKHLI